MRRTTLMLALALGSILPGIASAQDTNPVPTIPMTRLEMLETNTGTIIVRATSVVGTVSGANGAVVVKCKDFTDAGTGVREMGLGIDVLVGGQRVDSLLVDHNEITPLLSAIDYLSGVGWSVTTFPSFDASFTTRGGFRLAAFGGSRSGTIQFSARSVRTAWPPVQMSLDQMSQLRSLVQQAKAVLDGIKKAK